MSTIMIEELSTTLTQNFTTKHNFVLKALRPHLYLHNDPSGSFTITVKEGATTLSSSTLTLATILSEAGFSAEEYHYGAIRFNFDTHIILHPRTTYTIELSSSGYSFSESSYLGWVKAWDYRINTLPGTIPSGKDGENPFSYETWGYKCEY